MKTIASEAGVSSMTVSRALRNDPMLRVETIHRIHVIADKLGYRPDPRIAELMSRLRRGRSERSRDTIAFVRIVDPDKPIATAGAAQVVRGVSVAADRSGYSFEPFIWKIGQLSPSRMGSILHSRGIRGAVIHNEIGEGPLDLTGFPDRLACALIGPPISAPLLHRSGINRHYTVSTALEQCAARGYKRVGLFLSKVSDNYSEHIWLSSFIATQHRQNLLEPELTQISDKLDRDRFERWFRMMRPDAVLSDSQEVLKWVIAESAGSAERAGFVQLDWNPDCCPSAGIDQGFEEVGSIAVDLVYRQLLQNEVGIPKYPLISLTNGTWVDGETVRSKKDTEARTQRWAGQNVASS